MAVRTRFAPSPTGYLHIGGVRTALFNWLFARQHGGQFILRIDDTDQQRNVAEALQPILDGFRWLGLDWDEGAEVGGPYGPYYQSQRLDRYQQAVDQLLEKGLAYWDFATTEEMKAEREAAEKTKSPYLYSRRWLAESSADRKRFEAEGRTGSVKIKMPRDGTCIFQDHIRGEVRVEWSGEQDTVIRRSDGTVTYNLANVVDDFDMKISHVIRAEEHLSNTPRQIYMLEGLGYPRPEYAHVPFVAEPGSKNKLSKRKIAQYLKNPDFKKVYDHAKSIVDRLELDTTPESFNPVLIDFYKRVGYLPEAILNYLVLLGWSLDDKTEDFSVKQMVENFSLDRVNKGAASLDVKKLFAFQERYIQALPLSEKVDRVLPYLIDTKLVAEPVSAESQAKVEMIVVAAGPRIRVFGDILDFAYFFLPDEQISSNNAAAEKSLRDAYKGAAKMQPSLAELLGKLRELVALAEPFTAETLKQQIEKFAEIEGAKVGPLSQVFRIATTGVEVGFSAYDTMAVLGHTSCLARIDRAIQSIG